ncbi:VWA domain-containing protein [Amycolatopsis sacchari]|uniref:VWA domain-containing protein n=1 Tax=Amycolatopsis sacchari TaxID=115433 RepID=UPI003EB7DBC9
MEASLHRFARLLRLRDVRVSVSEVLDALRCAAAPGVLADRGVLKEALRGALVKDQRDDPVFGELFDAFFGLIRLGSAEQRPGAEPGEGQPGDGEVTLSEGASRTTQRGLTPGKPADLRDFFDPADLAERYNLHEEENKIELASVTDEIVFDKDNVVTGGDGYHVQVDVDRLHTAAPPGQLTTQPGARMDSTLSLAEHDALLAWLDRVEDAGGDEEDAAALRRRLAGALANLPEALKQHAEALLELERESAEPSRAADVARAGESERAELEEALRRLAARLRGALTSRRRVSRAGRVDAGRTMRRNMRFDGIPFNPVTVRRAEDRPRLVVLADVSLSVRATARFTLQVVYGLQDLFAQVRSFAFVDGIAETTELFAEHPLERALGLVFGGDVLDVDAGSEYGRAFGEFLAEHSSAVTRRTTVLVLGDGRGNGNDPNLTAFAEITRRAKETIWLTPEPRYSWGLGGCDLPAYAEYCRRVRVVRDLSGLDRVALDLVAR